MSADLAKDRFVTHAVTNYLNAGFQGRFAELNVLSQLSDERFSQDDLAKVQKVLSQITLWSEQLYKDECLLSASWTAPETFDAQHAIELLGSLKIQLSDLAMQAQQVLELTTFPSLEQLTLLIGAYTRHTYSRDHYIRGFIEYGTVFRIPDMAQRYEQVLELTKEELRRSSAFVGVCQNARRAAEGEGKDVSLLSKLEPGYFQVLHRSCLNLPGTFRTQVHDINQLTSPYSGGFNFSQAEFGPAESAEWQNYGFGPVQAGYWRAYSISPQEAKSWLDARVSEPAGAIEWKAFGFNSESAKPWSEAEFAPDYAAIWHKASYTPEKAKELIGKGVMEPPAKGDATS
ncbi:MAG: hypothetical protein DCC75_03315 [Proteobacteria bacterium]|nr:MAG: hypothetical protein DCC75_03315 [Pseudomonadota bacterium]